MLEHVFHASVVETTCSTSRKQHVSEVRRVLGFSKIWVVGFLKSVDLRGVLAAASYYRVIPNYAAELGDPRSLIQDIKQRPRLRDMVVRHAQSLDFHQFQIEPSEI